MEITSKTDTGDRSKPKEKEGTKKETETQKSHIKDTIKPIGGTEDQIVQNDLEYADDTQLLIERDKHGQLCERIGHYDISTEPRELKIQWAKSRTTQTCRKQANGAIIAALRANKTRRPGCNTRERNKHEWKPGESSISKNSKSAEHLGIVNCRLIRNKVINPMIQIMLCNSLIRCTMIYGLHTKELPRNLLNQLETYMYKHIRTMMNPRWKDEAWYPEEKQLYKKIQQSSMES